MRKLVLAACLVLALGGCAQSVQKDASYGKVTDLRDAVVKSGYKCPDWHQDNKVGAESGFCRPDNDGSFDQFVTFTDTASRDQHVASAKVFAAVDPTFGSLIVGPNWVVRLPSADVERVQAKMGGTISRSG